MAARNSVRARRVCFDTHRKQDENGRVYMMCSCGCEQRFNPATTAWRADHGARWAEDGKDTPENLWPIIEACDRAKKSPQDTSEIAKGKRWKDKHYGITRSKRPMPGSRASGEKKRMDGTVVKR